MSTKTLPEITQEPLDDEERELMDPDTWDWEHPIELKVIGKPGAILRMRFTQEEVIALADIAQREGVGLIELVHQTMLQRIAND